MGWRQFFTYLIGLGPATRWQQLRMEEARQNRGKGGKGIEDTFGQLAGLTLAGGI